jgi:hypothetical protein
MTASEIAYSIVNYHWPPIATDMGEIDAVDLYDHWAGGRPLEGGHELGAAMIVDVVAEMIRLNGGSETFIP